MPFDAGGNYTLPPGYEAVAGDTIQPSQHNPPLQDIGASLSLALIRDGRAALTGNINAGGFRITNAGAGVDPSDLATVAQVTAGGGGGGGSVPAGCVFYGAWPPGEIPIGFLHANGQIVNRVSFAALFTAIGTRFGAGDGSSTFQLPDLRGVVIRGLDSSKNYDPGRTFGSYQADELASHTHTGSAAAAGTHTHTAQAAAGGVHSHTATIASNGDHTHTLTIPNAGIHNHSATMNSAGDHFHSYQAAAMTGTPGSATGNGFTNQPFNTSTAGAHVHIIGVSNSGDHTHPGSTAATAGAHVHTATIADAGSHTHTLTVQDAGSHTHTLTIVATGGTETRMKNVALTPIIKT